MTKYIGVIGYPLRHTLSPVFQQAALDYYRMDAKYVAWETEPENLREAVERLRLPDIYGANITVPFKETVLGVVDEVDAVAATIGAVNTIANRDGKLAGFNTDSRGFIRSLKSDAFFEPRGKRIVILGAGGVSRAVAFSLLAEGASAIAVVNRTRGRAVELVKALSRRRSGISAGADIKAVPWENDRIDDEAKQAHLIVNCTTMGMVHGPAEGETPLTADRVPKNALIYDMVYNPAETPFLVAAKKAGARRLGGLKMLVYQGAASFELWTGRAAPVEVMMNAAKKAQAGLA
jgi:shikimate dehydrogenase